MRKSRAIRLVLLGGTGIALAGCDETPPADARFFPDVEACAAVNDQSTCEAALQESKAAFAAEAPRFASREACEAEFGTANCEDREAVAGTATGGYFMPIMMGYMLGSAFRQPVFRGPDNRAMVRSGGSTYAVGRFANVGRSASFQPAAVTRVQRGGFGATASSMRTSAGG